MTFWVTENFRSPFQAAFASSAPFICSLALSISKARRRHCSEARLLSATSRLAPVATRIQTSSASPQTMRAPAAEAGCSTTSLTIFSSIILEWMAHALPLTEAFDAGIEAPDEPLVEQIFRRAKPIIMRSAIRAGLILIFWIAAPASGRAADEIALGANTCSSSGCHGGGGDRRDQYVVWSQRDVHSRSYATLTTARSARMAEALSIPNPAASPRCVVCHAPLAGADSAGLGSGVDPAEGVSCGSCHGIPAGWIRGHTRPDWTHADRVAAGMRELKDLYGRANTCVACHQNLDPAIVAVGHHPALIFELDGQTQDEPKHWRDYQAGAQAWFVG